MDADRIAFFRERLKSIAGEIEAFLETSKDSAGVVELDTSIGRLSRMDAMQDQQMALELRRRKKRQFRQVNEALKRMDEGLYGLCGACGQQIAEERLEAFPDVMVCVSCA
ncbi:MAG: TraR/DksA C4-type zinc finger protein [Opitutales bacterium]